MLFSTRHSTNIPLSQTRMQSTYIVHRKDFDRKLSDKMHKADYTTQNISETTVTDEVTADCNPSKMHHSGHNNMKRKLTVLTMFVIILIACCAFNWYMDSYKSPSLAYPLSHYNVDNYDHQYAHIAVTGSVSNSVLNGDGIPKHSNLSPTSKIRYQGSEAMLPSVITKKHTASAVFGPFQSQLPDQFELYNTHSLVLVALLFICSFLLLS
jgi:hypothetical protein